MECNPPAKCVPARIEVSVRALVPENVYICTSSGVHVWLHLCLCLSFAVLVHVFMCGHDCCTDACVYVWS